MSRRTERSDGFCDVRPGGGKIDPCPRLTKKHSGFPVFLPPPAAPACIVDPRGPCMRIKIDVHDATAPRELCSELCALAADELSEDVAQIDDEGVRIMSPSESPICVVAIGLTGGSLVAERAVASSFEGAARTALRAAARVRAARSSASVRVRGRLDCAPAR